MLGEILDSGAGKRNPLIAYLACVLVIFAGLVGVLFAAPNVWGNWPALVGVFIGYVLMAVLGALLLWTGDFLLGIGRLGVERFPSPSDAVVHVRIFSELLACRAHWSRARKACELHELVTTPAFERLAKKILSRQYVLHRR
jgi:hypothetical protein